MSESTNTQTESVSGSPLTEEEKKEIGNAIANDIYRRASLAQVIQLVQTQCANQANTIIENATAEEIENFRKQLADNTPSED